MRIREGDQADIFDIIQKRQNTVVHLKVDEEQFRIVRGKRVGIDPSRATCQGYGTSHITHRCS